MNEAVKQKIVGVAVVTVVLAVLLPTLFDQPIQDELLNRGTVAKQPPDLAIENFVPIARERELGKAQQNIELSRKDDGQVLSEETVPQQAATTGTEPASAPVTTISPPAQATGANPVADKTSASPAPPPSKEIQHLREAVDSLMDTVQRKSDPEPLSQGAATSVAAAWSLQMGSFSDQANAVKLRQRLTEQGEKAYLRASASSQGKVIYRVYVGPVLKESDARALQSRLQNTQGQKGMVVKYLPE